MAGFVCGDSNTCVNAGIYRFSLCHNKYKEIEWKLSGN